MKRVLLVVVLVLIIVAIFYLNSLKSSQREGGSASVELQVSSETAIAPADGNETVAQNQILSAGQRRARKAEQYEVAKEIENPAGFINTDLIKLQDIVGKKVILVDFWTYSCINCQRTIPYLRGWYEKYKDQGLEIVGVHTPEFEFEKKRENVLAAVQKFGVNYPVVQDNDYGTWRAYKNLYWPRKYLIDIDGFIVYDHIGEGAYEETEQKIQELLTERMRVLGIPGEIAKTISEPQNVIEADEGLIATPEIYFGANRNFYLANGAQRLLGQQALSALSDSKLNQLQLVGSWNFEREYAQNQSAGAKIILRYNAKAVYMVANGDRPIRMKILRDGKPLSQDAGDDVMNINGESIATVREDQLYKLIEDPEGYGEHLLEIIIEEPGLRAFTFTFG